jgi:ParB family chromosome partitioning protein
MSKKSSTEKKTKAKAAAPAPEATKIPKGGANVVNLPTESISPRKGFNPRTDLGEMRELKASLREHGLIAPITVCPTKAGADSYFIIAGHRRHAAWAELGKANIPAVVRDIAIDSPEAFQIAMSENSDEARTPLSADDQTAAFTRLLEQFGGEGHEVEVAKVAGYSAATVKRALRYALVPKQVREKVAKGDIGRTVALATLDIPEEVREKVISKIAAGTTERDVRTLANEAKADMRKGGKDVERKTTDGRASRHNVPFGQDEGKIATPRGARESADMRRKLTALVLNCEADVEEAKTTDEQVAARVALTAARAALAALYWLAGITGELIEQLADTKAEVALDDKSFLAAEERGKGIIIAAAEEAQAAAKAKADEETKPEKSKTGKIEKNKGKDKAKAKAKAAKAKAEADGDDE